MRLLEDFVTLPPDISGVDGSGQGYPLYITAKRYYVKELEDVEGDPDAVSILALHSTSFHMETWEPTLEVLFGLLVKNGTGKVKVREVWAVDCPNHGHAGVLNREILKRGGSAIVPGCEHYATAVHRFLVNAPRALGVDFSKRRFVGLGHSLGANSILLLQMLEPVFTFISLIIVEPMLSPGGERHLAKLRVQLVDGAKRRTREWPDRETAFSSFKSNPRTANWDESVLRAFVKHAIAPTSSNAVGLACMHEQEVVRDPHAMYLDVEGATKPVEELTRLCSLLPVHLVLGLHKDFIPQNVHEDLLDPASGRKYASVTEIPDVGHLIPQRIPNKLGALIYELLTFIMERPAKL
ncbi:hypothetical protein P691DRAFT_672782 [Macrolepiota fuliginosa MF-IS2]|uniref:AB hydrolase-1 domain-containing protein n=1 Tax=Macrolepiota fuliginosa MF-IS2 TaxID=1400762 RepID=A0A9P5XAN7_9AGAR|nr:hypothetical protein P691DRAFT_672782 [Macrolepiota fuliginosa MF-IS2]